MDQQNRLRKLALESQVKRQHYFGKRQPLFAVATLYLTLTITLLTIHLSSELGDGYRAVIFIVCFTFIGWCQYTLSIALHELIHQKSLNTSKQAYLWALTAYPIFQGHRCKLQHLNHHVHLGTNLDPDIEMYKDFPCTKKEFLLRQLHFGLGAHSLNRIALSFIKMLTLNNLNLSKLKNWEIWGKDFLYITLTQMALFGLFFLLFKSANYYLVLWILPYLTIKPSLSSLRILCEHGSPKGWVIRSFEGSKWATWLLAPLNMGYHFEHHSIPTIPCTLLKEIHKVYTGSCIRRFDSKYPNWQEHVIYEEGHLKFLLTLYKSLPWKTR